MLLQSSSTGRISYQNTRALRSVLNLDSPFRWSPSHSVAGPHPPYPAPRPARHTRLASPRSPPPCPSPHSTPSAPLACPLSRATHSCRADRALRQLASSAPSSARGQSGERRWTVSARGSGGALRGWRGVVGVRWRTAKGVSDTRVMRIASVFAHLHCVYLGAVVRGRGLMTPLARRLMLRKARGK